jgi:hypothetical protein
MYKTLITISLCAILGHIGFAQTGYKTWSPNGLTWTDFAARPDLTQTRASSFAYLIGYKREQTSSHDTAIVYNKVYGVMNQLDSWVKTEAKTNELLMYNQLVFDLVELSVRKIQLEMNREPYPDLSVIPAPQRGVAFSMAKHVFETNLAKAKQRIQLFEQETQFGTNSTAIALWAKQIQDELNAQPIVLIPNDLKSKKNRFGLFLGGGVGTMQGNLNAYFQSWVPTGSYGVDLGFGRYQFTFEMAGNLSNDYLIKPLNYNGVLYEQGLNLNYTWAQITAGYALIDRKYWRIAPYAGLSLVSISANLPTKKNLGIKDTYGVIGGVSADYKFRKKIILSEMRNGTLFEQSVKLRLGLTEVVFSRETSHELYGASVIGSLSYCISLSGIK